MTDDEALIALAARHGIETEWWDYLGRHRQVGVETLRALLRCLGVEASRPREALAALAAAPHSLPTLLTGIAGTTLRLTLPGTAADGALRWQIVTEGGTRHDGIANIAEDGEGRYATIPLPEEPGEATLELTGAWKAASALAIAPPTCFLGPLAGRRLWGLSLQVYGLREVGDGGLGHLGALAGAARAAAACGAEALMLSPLHALFAADPAHHSPYSPSSRAHLNGWLADPAGLPEVAALADLVADCGLADELARLADLSLIDYARAIPARLALLRALFRRFTARHRPGSPLGDEFAGFVRDGGERLRLHALFEALHAERFAVDPLQWDWRRWPAPLRDPASPEVERFARERAEEVSFHAFLQWLASRQIAAAQSAARESGMRIGLIADLAVGTHTGGSRAWARRAALLEGVTIGAPPDLLNRLGQNWGLTTFAPEALAAQGFAAFREEVRATARGVGGLRLDHVMGLARIWCIPEGAPPHHGAYLRFPRTDLCNLLALESHAARSIVIGEDLGTVEPSFRETMAAYGILGMRVLFFERDSEGGFTPPERYDAMAMATTTTHDLATVAGWWRGVDVSVRGGLGLLGEGRDEAGARDERERERHALWQALRAHGGAEGDWPGDDPTPVGIAAARFIARTRCALAMLPVEDALLSPDQLNLPGTVAEHPNWRRRLPAPLPRLLSEPPARDVLQAMREARPRDGEAG